MKKPEMTKTTREILEWAIHNGIMACSERSKGVIIAKALSALKELWNTYHEQDKALWKKGLPKVGETDEILTNVWVNYYAVGKGYKLSASEIGVIKAMSEAITERLGK